MKLTKQERYRDQNKINKATKEAYLFMRRVIHKARLFKRLKATQTIMHN